MGLGTESHCHNKDLALSLQQLGGTPVPSPALCVAWRSGSMRVRHTGHVVRIGGLGAACLAHSKNRDFRVAC